MMVFKNPALYLEVFDMCASTAFYRDQLGFEVVYATPVIETRRGPLSRFMVLRRDAVKLMLNLAGESDDSEVRGNRVSNVQLYIDVDDVDELHGELVQRGLGGAPPTPAGFGHRAMIVMDPDGHRVVFHEGAHPSQ